MLNTQGLKGVMVRNGDTQETLAAALGLSLSRLNAKINMREGADFTLSEVIAIVNRYSLHNSEIEEIFFAHE